MSAQVDKCNQLVNFKATEPQVVNYANAAQVAGTNRSKWIKKTLDQAARKLLRRRP